MKQHNIFNDGEQNIFNMLLKSIKIVKEETEIEELFPSAVKDSAKFIEESQKTQTNSSLNSLEATQILNVPNSEINTMNNDISNNSNNFGNSSEKTNSKVRTLGPRPNMPPTYNSIPNTNNTENVPYNYSPNYYQEPNINDNNNQFTGKWNGFATTLVLLGTLALIIMVMVVSLYIIDYIGL